MISLSGRLIITVVFLLFFSVNGMAAEKATVFVSILPQKYFVQQIGKDLVDVHVMVQPGASPATYEPKPRQMAALSKARAYFSVGVPFEKFWLKKIASANPNMKLVRTDRGIEKISMAAHHHDHDHDHGDAHGHEQEVLDPHIWLSPPLVKIQARSIMKALQDIDPVHREIYSANYNKFAARIDRLDLRLKQIFAGKGGMTFMVFHPSWGYFARTYGLKQVSIEIEGKDPKPAQLKALIEHAKEHNIKVVFVQPQFSKKSAKLVAGEIGGQVVVADPLALDWLSNLSQVAEKIGASNLK